MLAKLRGKRGFTLVELMIVVCIIGVLAALAIYGVRRYVTNSKTSEARQMLGRITKDAANAFNRENMVGAVLATNASTAITQALCTTALTTVPVGIASVGARKYQSAPSEWTAGATDQAGWRCLKFAIEGPQYYMYQYVASDVSNFQAVAQGNLNGDGVYSTFEMDGQVRAGTVAISPTVIETNPDE